MSPETMTAAELRDEFRKGANEAISEADFVSADEAREIIDRRISKADKPDAGEDGDLPEELVEELEEEELANGEVSPERAGEILDRLTDEPDGVDQDDDDVEKAIPLASLAARTALASGVEETVKDEETGDLISQLEEEGVPEDLIDACAEYLAKAGVEKALDVDYADPFLAESLDKNEAILNEQLDRQERVSEAIEENVARGDAEAPVLDATVYDGEEGV